MPKIVDHDIYRQELLQRSTQVFVSRGYGEISMRDIASAIEVSTGTLYHYFPSKEDLFRHLFLFHARHSTTQLVATICGVEGRKARLERLLQFFQNQCDGMRMQFLLSADMLRHELPAKSSGLLRRWASGMKRKVADLLSIDAVTTEMLFCFLSGTIYNRVLSGSADDLAPVFLRFQKLLET